MNLTSMKVTVYIPTKNRFDSLRLAVDSVLNQSYSDIEIIIVDDGSTDNTPIYLAQLIESYSRVKIFRNDTSKGACNARNAAILAATGDFVTGLDDDDEFVNNHISALVDYWYFLTQYSNEPISCLYTQTISKNNEKRYITKKPSRVEYKDLFITNDIGNQVFAPRSYYIEAGLFDEQMPAWQDREFFVRLLKQFGAARLLDLPTYVFDVSPRPDRISVGTKEKVLKACDRMILLHANNDGRLSQKMMLQVFDDYYGFTASLADICKFVKQGIWLAGYIRIIKEFTPLQLIKIYVYKVMGYSEHGKKISHAN